MAPLIPEPVDYQPHDRRKAIRLAVAVLAEYLSAWGAQEQQGRREWSVSVPPGLLLDITAAIEDKLLEFWNTGGNMTRTIPRLRRFGAVTFEETGEVREAELGEWFLGSNSIDVHYRSWQFNSPTASPFAILRPVRVETADAE